MDLHIQNKRHPAKDASEQEKWFGDVDAMAAALLYKINIVVHENSNSLYSSSNWRVYNPNGQNQVILASQDRTRPSIFIDFVGKNHFQIVLNVRLV